MEHYLCHFQEWIVREMLKVFNINYCYWNCHINVKVVFQNRQLQCANFTATLEVVAMALSARTGTFVATAP